MTARHDLDRQLDAFLLDGPTELPDPSFDAVRDRIEQTRQRVAIGPWRLPDMNRIVPIGLAAALVIGVIVVGAQLFRPADSSGVGGAPAATATPAPQSPSGALGGTVTFRLDGLPTTTKVDLVADGASVSGTAVTSGSGRTHTVQVECAARGGDTWAVAGTVAQTTVPGEAPGSWSAVIVREGSPQQIGIWLSDAKTSGVDCAGWLRSIDLPTIDPENFNPVESGALVPPPGASS